jgi:transcriptional regulator with XRE-family HTH domain
MIRLTHERHRRGWSQAEVSRRTGIHPTTISHLESGEVKPWPAYREKLSVLFGLSTELLFEEEVESDAT